jgi:hypothetical protein
MLVIEILHVLCAFFDRSQQGEPLPILPCFYKVNFNPFFDQKSAGRAPTYFL